jgi:hypothetical protein
MKLVQNLEEIQKKALPGFTFSGEKGTIGNIVSEFTKYLFPLAGILLLLFLIYGGFSLMTSGGDPKAVQGAKSKITNALIGFVIVFAAYWIVQIVASVLGLGKIGEIFNLNL